MSPVRQAFALLLLAVALVAAGCDASAASAAPTPSGSPKTVSGAASTDIAVSGAVKMTIAALGACDPEPVSALFQTQVGSTLYLLQIEVGSVTHPGDFPVTHGEGTTTVTLSDPQGAAWESSAQGGSGTVTVATGLRAGSISVTLVNSDDGTHVEANGTWKCR